MKFLNAKGQAVLEYILLIFVAVIFFAALLGALAGSTQKFANNYFGAYFQCLLETGELPSLGADSIPETECDELYEPFTVADGRPPKPISITDSSNGGDSNNDSSSGDNSASDSGGSGSASSGSSENSNPMADSNSGSFGRTQKVPLSGADKNGKGGSGTAGGSVAFNNFQTNDEFGKDGSGRSEYVPIYGLRTGDEDEEMDKNKVVKVDAPEDQEKVLRGKRVPTSDMTKDDEKKVADEGMSFPDWIRILIIAAIIIVIVIFFGGQVMNYQKSQE